MRIIAGVRIVLSLKGCLKILSYNVFLSLNPRLSGVSASGVEAIYKSKLLWQLSGNSGKLIKNSIFITAVNTVAVSVSLLCIQSFVLKVFTGN